MKIISMIPARYNATRFPGKLMKNLAGKPVILRTYEATLATKLFHDVFVVTDSDIIFNTIVNAGGKAIMSKKEHESGSDRIAEAVSDFDIDIVINVQGDEPFIDKASLSALIDVFKADKAKKIDLTSLMVKITDTDEIKNPNTVKVVVDKNNNALYFSRSPIPYQRDTSLSNVAYFKHKGVYAFRKEALMEFTNSKMLMLEASEKIEALRYLEYGKTIKMVETDIQGIEIDTLEDLERANKKWK